MTKAITAIAKLSQKLIALKNPLFLIKKCPFITKSVSTSQMARPFLAGRANDKVSSSSSVIKKTLMCFVRAKIEAERLNESFGIGMIELKSDNILFEAKERELDIRTLNMLVDINTDFRTLIENVNDDIDSFLTTKKHDRINKNNYDTILSGDKLESYKQEIRRKAE